MLLAERTRVVFCEVLGLRRHRGGLTMGWSIGSGPRGRDIGYGVPATCDHKKCSEPIDRGVSYVCERDGGCGLYFCDKHLFAHRCGAHDPKPDIPRWIWWKYTARSWREWRSEQAKQEMADLKKRASAYRPTADDIEYLSQDEEQG